MSVRRTLLFVLFIVALSTLLIAQLINNPAPSSLDSGLPVASGNDEQQQAGDGTERTVELTAAVYMDRLQYEELLSLNARFSREHPHIRVEVTNLDPAQAYGILSQRAKEGRQTDIVLLDLAWVNEFAASGWLSRELDHRARVKEDAVRRLVEWNGYVWAVPYELDPYVMAYNSDAFSDIGSLPSTPLEWLQYRDSRAERLAELEGAIYSAPGDIHAFLSLVWALGGDWVADESGMYAVHASELEALDALFGRWRADEAGEETREETEEALSDATGEPSDPGGLAEAPPILHAAWLSEDERWARLAEGTLSAMVIRASEWENRIDVRSVHPQIQLMHDSEGEAIWTTGTGYAIASSSEHPSEAAEWIDAMMPNGRKSDFAGGRSLPSDPELRIKLELLRSALSSVMDGTIRLDEWNEQNIRRWEDHPRRIKR